MKYLDIGNSPNTGFGKRTTISNEQYYQYGWARVGHLMQPLSRACRVGDMLLAQRILQDLRLEWESQDVLARVSVHKHIKQYHLESNCLALLSLLIFGKLNGQNTFQYSLSIASEIKRIDDRLDTMFFSIGHAERTQK
jgi:hypothetical protein